MKMKEIPTLERPRERLINYGVESLSNQELLSILLKTGSKEQSVQEVAVNLLNVLGNLSSWPEVTLEQIASIKGIGIVKATSILACLELGKRIYLTPKEEKIKLATPEEIFKNSSYLFYGKKQEYFYCFYFNNKQELIERKLLFMGTIDKSIVHPREIFKEAYLVGASKIACLHNHPSGNLEPSTQDIRLTNSLKEIGNIQGIPLIDHIIVSDTAFYSFYEHGLL